jgi:hypothetical protein
MSIRSESDFCSRKIIEISHQQQNYYYKKLERNLKSYIRIGQENYSCPESNKIFYEYTFYISSIILLKVKLGRITASAFFSSGK